MLTASCDLARVRDAYSRFKLATLEFARACKVASDHGHSGRTIAAHVGCSEATVRRSLTALRHHDADGIDYHDAYQAICDAANAPKTPKPRSDDVSPRVSDTDVSDHQGDSWPDTDPDNQKTPRNP